MLVHGLHTILYQLELVTIMFLVAVPVSCFTTGSSQRLCTWVASGLYSFDIVRMPSIKGIASLTFIDEQTGTMSEYDEVLAWCGYVDASAVTSIMLCLITISLYCVAV